MLDQSQKTMDKYYKFRQEIHKLYDHDVYNTGDLCSKILGIRDKEKCVESVKIALQNYSISIELSSDTNMKKRTEITNKITKSIGYYIIDNRDKLDSNIVEDESFDTFISNPSLYCDIIIIGNYIMINL